MRGKVGAVKKNLKNKVTQKQETLKWKIRTK